MATFAKRNACIATDSGDRTIQRGLIINKTCYFDGRSHVYSLFLHIVLRIKIILIFFLITQQVLLNQYLFTVLDEQTLLSLAHALTLQVVDLIAHCFLCIESRRDACSLVANDKVSNTSASALGL